MESQADLVRRVAIREYIEPARSTNTRRVSIRQGDLKATLVPMGLPAGNANQVGAALEAEKFWKPLGLKLLSPKGQSRAADTVYEFEFAPSDATAEASRSETPSERAFRLTERLRGLMKDEIASFGGTEAFMRWVRSDEDEDAE